MIGCSAVKCANHHLNKSFCLSFLSHITTMICPMSALIGVYTHRSPRLQIACGLGHTLALSSSGILYGWGYNGRGELLNAPSRARYATQLTAGGNRWVEDSILLCVALKSPAGAKSLKLPRHFDFSWPQTLYPVIDSQILELNEIFIILQPMMFLQMA